MDILTLLATQPSPPPTHGQFLTELVTTQPVARNLPVVIRIFV